MSFENNQMLKTVKHSFAGRKSIFFLFLNYVFSYCKQSYVPIYQNYNLLLIPFYTYKSLNLLTICHLISKTPLKLKKSFSKTLVSFSQIKS